MHELNCMEDSMFVHVKKYTIFKIMRQDKMQFRWRKDIVGWKMSEMSLDNNGFVIAPSF